MLPAPSRRAKDFGRAMRKPFPAATAAADGME
jgi:hypothetical protein